MGTEKITVIATPGHTQGGISLYTPGIVFSGDTLFCEGIGRTDLPGGDFQQLLDAIAGRLYALPPETLVLPGHGDSTTIEHEVKYNPFCENEMKYQVLGVPPQEIANVEAALRILDHAAEITDRDPDLRIEVSIGADFRARVRLLRTS